MTEVRSDTSSTGGPAAAADACIDGELPPSNAHSDMVSFISLVVVARRGPVVRRRCVNQADSNRLDTVVIMIEVHTHTLRAIVVGGREDRELLVAVERLPRAIVSCSLSVRSPHSQESERMTSTKSRRGGLGLSCLVTCRTIDSILLQYSSREVVKMPLS
jgi:hypothetical protein